MPSQEQRLYQGVSTSNVELVRSLLVEGTNPNTSDANEGRTPLTKAILVGNLEVIETLLQAEIDVNRIDDVEDTPLGLAVSSGNLQLVKRLLKEGAEANWGGFDPNLYRAVQNPEIVRVLLEAGADPNTRNDEGYTALMRAAGLGCLETVKLLINANANVNTMDKDGNTPLLYAADAGQQEVFEYLSSLSFLIEDIESALKLLTYSLQHKRRE